MIDPFTALCCLLSAADALVGGMEHVYPTANMTWPYCGHSAVIGRELERTDVDNDGTRQVSLDGLDRVWFHRFEVSVLRGAPPMPEDPANRCVAGIYGDCASDADCSTIAGHYKLVASDREALRAGLLAAWCECMAVDVADPENPVARRARHLPAWYETGEQEGEGRYSGTTLTVVAQLM